MFRRRSVRSTGPTEVLDEVDENREDFVVAGNSRGRNRERRKQQIKRLDKEVAKQRLTNKGIMRHCVSLEKEGP